MADSSHESPEPPPLPPEAAAGVAEDAILVAHPVGRRARAVRPRASAAPRRFLLVLASCLVGVLGAFLVVEQQLEPEPQIERPGVAAQRFLSALVAGRGPARLESVGDPEARSGYQEAFAQLAPRFREQLGWVPFEQDWILHEQDFGPIVAYEPCGAPDGRPSVLHVAHFRLYCGDPAANRDGLETFVMRVQLQRAERRYEVSWFELSPDGER